MNLQKSAEVLFPCRFCDTIIQVMFSANELPKRKRLRLENFDYSSQGAYFITICTHNRKNTLSHIVGAIRESPLHSRSVISKAVGYIKMCSSKEIHNRFGNAAFTTISFATKKIMKKFRNIFMKILQDGNVIVFINKNRGEVYYIN